MKLIELFEDFLNNSVNLNQTRIDALRNRVETIKEFVSGSEFAPQIIRFAAQGSWAHGTIIRPSDASGEFDADLVVFLEKVEQWEANDYILGLRRVFWNSDRYRDKTTLKTRCITINYAGDFHLDIIPVVIEDDYPNNFPACFVCNRRENVFEETDGDGFAEWWLRQNAVTGGNLTKVARLIKYLRDVKETFSVKSVLLTALLGQQVTAVDQFVNTNNFADLPTALATVMGRLDDWLQLRPALPEIENPVLSGENFTRNWTQDQYENFRKKVHQYRAWIDDAYGERDRDESIRKWRRVFGPKFAKGATLERATSVMGRLAEGFAAGQDLVGVVLAYGRQVLDRIPKILPHVEPSPYQVATHQLQVRVVAQEKRAKGGMNLRPLMSGDPIQADRGIEFRALQSSGLPFPKDFEVTWQVVNTDRAAAADDCLRGGFYDSDTHGYRYEATKYRGVHWVQAYVIQKRSGLLMGKSERFFVVIT